MANSKIPVANTISLSSLAGEEFYAVIIQEERMNRKWYTMWLFCKRCDVAHLCFEKIAYEDDSTMTVDGIKALDAMGKFDENKEMLAELAE